MKDHKEFLLDEIHTHATTTASPNNLLHHLLQQKHNDLHHRYHHLHNHNHNNNPYGFVYVNGERVVDSGSSRFFNGRNDMHEDDPSSHYKYICVSPVSGFSLKSEGSPSSSHSGGGGGFSLLDQGTPNSPPLFEETTTKSSCLPLRKNAFYMGGLPLESHATGNLRRGDLNLSRSLQNLCINDQKQDSSVFLRSPVDSCGVQAIDCLGKTKNGSFDHCGNVNYHFGRTQCLFPGGNVSLDEAKRSALLGLQQESQVVNLSGSGISSVQFPSLVSNLGQYIGKIDSNEHPPKLQHVSDEALSKLKLQSGAAFHRNCDNTGIRVSDSIAVTTRPPISDASHCSQRTGIDTNGGTAISSLNSPLVSSSWMPQGAKSLQCYSLPVVNGSVGANPNAWIPQPVSSIGNVSGLEAFTCEDSLIIQEKGSKYILKKRCDQAQQQKQHFCNETGWGNLCEKSSELYGPTNSEISQIPKSYSPFLLPLKYNSLSEVQGYIYIIAKDQHGCRFLQKKFAEGTPQDVQIIFDEIIDHVVELMMNPFGNYLIQKLLEVCNEEQRTEILHMVTSETGRLVEISLNSYGTRAVQKLIGTLGTRQQISLIISALEPGFLKLIKDLNGNHVVQRCLECLSYEDNKFIFNAAARYCVDIATHRHGCCVLQQCIAHSTGEQRKNLVTEISANGLLLAQDAFGNYVVQYLLELKVPFVTEKLISQFQGNYVQLSVQKFSSNVIERCLKLFRPEDQSTIIHELFSTSQFELLLQDPYANYVVQTALGVSKGPLHAALVAAIRPYSATLRASPYCKRIFSRTLLRK